MNALYKDPIVDVLVDDSTEMYPNHTMFTHLGCILLRIFIGMYLIESQNMSHIILTIVLALAVIMFFLKYVKQARDNTKVLWKFYPRMILAYALALYFMNTSRSKEAGFLIIVDALIAFQSRHTASAASFAIMREKKNPTSVV